MSCETMRWQRHERRRAAIHGVRATGQRVAAATVRTLRIAGLPEWVLQGLRLGSARLRVVQRGRLGGR
ncbi:hypothetical protein AS9A_3786 [Hoyosella subflava DQS3-9A1]|uniref:Uncharacterized protein n=1 Tax=Hoyosella subflava (strain DSM 45089 / JCM 17490 / NBRC 109087 / DQS3-9A1) TaxID=443218 RepID=F6EFW0_HOYSD|nr:hypothetical protein AS9A_3786 [Hoyosella subflava DQS3-9A1]